MKLWKLALCAATASFGLAGAALADSAPTGPQVAWNAAITNDYVFRGISQNAGNAAGSGGIDVTDNIVYVGTWLSNVNFGDKTRFENDLYGGVRPTVAGISLDLGVIYYNYIDAPHGSDWNYWEAKALASKAFGPVTIGGAFYYSPEYTGHNGNSEYYEVNGAYTMANKATISGAVGYQALSKSDTGISGYGTWNIGVTYPLNDHLGIDLRYIGTDHHADTFFTQPLAGDRLAATLKATF